MDSNDWNFMTSANFKDSEPRIRTVRSDVRSMMSVLLSPTIGMSQEVRIKG